jgi:hypothetical protein
VTVSATGITGLAPAAISYGPGVSQLTVSGGSGDSSYLVTDTPAATVLNTGSGADVVSVLGTTGPLLVAFSGGSDVLNLGNAGSVQGLLGAVTVTDPLSGAIVNVDDSADATGQTVTLGTFTPPGDSAYGQITGLAPAAISYRLSDTSQVNLAGGVGGNTLIGPDGGSVWQLTGTDAGTVSAGAAPVVFTSFGNLFGGAGANLFQFADGASVSGTIGGTGSNTLDYSAYTSNVCVNLQTGLATGVGGGVSNVQSVLGGNGGPAGSYNVLVGAGGDVLTGGNGRRNLLIAGGSASTLVGGDDDDILIAGTTAYDQNDAALLSLMAEWTRTDEDFDTRVFNLTNGINAPLLDATTVTSNSGGNTLTGGPGQNLFFGTDQDTFTDWDPVADQLIGL